MVTAIIAAIATIVVALVAIGVFMVIRSRRDGMTAKPHSHGRDVVKSIDSVGIMSSGGGEKVASSRPVSATKAPMSTTGRASEPVRSRFVAVGVLAAAVFGSLAAKLWSMQVLSSSQYESKARRNKYSIVSTPAPRGLIYDSDGVVLVKNRTVFTVLADAQVADDRDVLMRLSTVLGIPFNIVRQRIQDQSSGAQSQRVVARVPLRVAAICVLPASSR